MSDLAWSRLDVEPVELSEVAENHEVFRDILGLQPQGTSREENRVWKWMSNALSAGEMLNATQR